MCNPETMNTVSCNIQRNWTDNECIVIRTNEHFCRVLVCIIYANLQINRDSGTIGNYSNNPYNANVHLYLMYFS